jgi:acetylornithine deacetylase/succinyl-diaminopimelate desuccinylase-like protein
MKVVQPCILALCFLFLTTTTFSQNTTIINKELKDSNALVIEQALSRYIQFNSTSGYEKEAGVWLKQLCETKGLHITSMGTKNGNYNFSASLYPLSEKLPNIIFLNHIDVVPPGDISKWEYPPYSGKITDTEIWGRGAFDNKGNAMMQLFALLTIKEKYKDIQLPYNITFLAVSVEETQTEGGAQFVVENYLENLNPAVLIGEGAPGITGILEKTSEKPLFGISVAHKRALWIELELSIKTFGHGSVTPNNYPTKAMNEALHRLLKKKSKVVYNDLNVDFLKQLGHVEKGFKGWILKHPRFFKWVLTPQLRKKEELFALFCNTTTLTGVQSEGKTINVIPSTVKATLDCRLLPYESSELFLKKLKKRLNNDSIKVTIKENMPDVTPSNNQTNYYKSIEKALLQSYPNSDVITTLLPNFNDVGIFRLFNVPAYAITPLVLERAYLEHIHNENERIPIEKLYKGKDAYVRIINQILKQQSF